MDELQNVILREGSLTQKIVCYIIPFILNSRTSRTNLLCQKIRIVVISRDGGKGKCIRELLGWNVLYLTFCVDIIGYKHLNTSL